MKVSQAIELLMRVHNAKGDINIGITTDDFQKTFQGITISVVKENSECQDDVNALGGVGNTFAEFY